MREQLERLKQEALQAINDAPGEDALLDIRVRFLGRKGELTALMKGLGTLTPEERPLVGQLVNSIRDEIETSLEAGLLAARELAKSAWSGWATSACLPRPCSHDTATRSSATSASAST